mmetsp:Transcript_116/g.488  ORF Transcript_116/g.488 Transcript_116/m.488 type:complete len:295 (+) Transcript_116:3798-4682(+)
MRRRPHEACFRRRKRLCDAEGVVAGIALALHKPTHSLHLVVDDHVGAQLLAPEKGFQADGAIALHDLRQVFRGYIPQSAQEKALDGREVHEQGAIEPHLLHHPSVGTLDALPTEGGIAGAPADLDVHRGLDLGTREVLLQHLRRHVLACMLREIDDVGKPILANIQLRVLPNDDADEVRADLSQRVVLGDVLQAHRRLLAERALPSLRHDDLERVLADGHRLAINLAALNDLHGEPLRLQHGADLPRVLLRLSLGDDRGTALQLAGQVRLKILFILPASPGPTPDGVRRRQRPL